MFNLRAHVPRTLRMMTQVRSGLGEERYDGSKMKVEVVGGQTPHGGLGAVIKAQLPALYRRNPPLWTH